MKIWTYKEMKDKLVVDNDLEEETFISPNELAGYFNEALTEAESEILTLWKDYFITKYFLPSVQGQIKYALPFNIFASMIRKFVYSNGSIYYEIKRFRRLEEFTEIELIQKYGGADWYTYTTRNDVPGQSHIEIYPAVRETAILPPQSGSFTPFILYYLRNCARVPLISELCNPELLSPSQVDIVNDEIQTNSGINNIGIQQQGVVGAFPGSIFYETGDVVQVEPTTGGTLPSPLEVKTDYFVIKGLNGLIKLASTLQNAYQGIAIDLTSQGAVSFVMRVRATEEIQNATLIDIPEFATFIMQWVRCRVYEKEGDPRIEKGSQVLMQQKKQMVDTLTNRIPDDNDEIQADYSFYNDFS